ncbi:MAG: hypothetical protein QXX36_03735 [Candidatus Rehaiarchaeum fermentans]|nr:hypothetical protein [Candidatus Rehaiarchaeum fermentans]
MERETNRCKDYQIGCPGFTIYVYNPQDDVAVELNYNNRVAWLYPNTYPVGVGDNAYFDIVIVNGGVLATYNILFVGFFTCGPEINQNFTVTTDGTGYAYFRLNLNDFASQLLPHCSFPALQNYTISITGYCGGEFVVQGNIGMLETPPLYTPTPVYTGPIPTPSGLNVVAVNNPQPGVYEVKTLTNSNPVASLQYCCVTNMPLYIFWGQPNSTYNIVVYGTCGPLGNITLRDTVSTDSTGNGQTTISFPCAGGSSEFTMYISGPGITGYDGYFILNGQKPFTPPSTSTPTSTFTTVPTTTITLPPSVTPTTTSNTALIGLALLAAAGAGGLAYYLARKK